MELVDRPGCYLWNPAPQDNETVTWSGGCSNGLAQGDGRVTWYENDELSQIVEGRLQDGRRHGTWTEYDESGNELGTIRYENGRRVGGFGRAARLRSEVCYELREDQPYGSKVTLVPPARFFCDNVCLSPP